MGIILAVDIIQKSLKELDKCDDADIIYGGSNSFVGDFWNRKR